VRQIQLGASRSSRSACRPGDADGLSAVVGLRSRRVRTCSLRAAGLGFAQFVSGIIDDVGLGCAEEAEAPWLRIVRQHDDGEEQKHSSSQGEHAAVGRCRWRFSGSAFWSAGESGAKGGLEFFPARGPFHQKARRFGHCVTLSGMVRTSGIIISS